MGDLAIQLFGTLRIQHGKRELQSMAEGKARELLCYLLLQPWRTHEREALASAHWAECTTTQSRKYLRTALWQIRVNLSEPVCNRILMIGPDAVEVRLETDVTIDVTEFERAHLSTYGMPGHDLDPATAVRLETAVELYRGDLLEGCYQDWCLCERQRLQNIYLALLDKLMDHCESSGEFEKGLSFGARVLRCDAANERTHQRLMRLYYHAGDRAGALRQYRHCVAALKADLDVAPARRTVDLYEHICADDLDSQELPKCGAAQAPQINPVGETVSRLKSIREELVDLQKKLQIEIRRLDQALGIDRGQCS